MRMQVHDWDARHSIGVLSSGARDVGTPQKYATAE
jgi:hypothetical protein